MVLEGLDGVMGIEPGFTACKENCLPCLRFYDLALPVLSLEPPALSDTVPSTVEGPYLLFLPLYPPTWLSASSTSPRKPSMPAPAWISPIRQPSMKQRPLCSLLWLAVSTVCVTLGHICPRLDTDMPVVLCASLEMDRM